MTPSHEFLGRPMGISDIGPLDLGGVQMPLDNLDIIKSLVRPRLRPLDQARQRSLLRWAIDQIIDWWQGGNRNATSSMDRSVECPYKVERLFLPQISFSKN